MISFPRIVRHAARCDYEHLFEDVLRNGPPLPLALRMRLGSGADSAPAALGLALKRIIEVTHRPTEASRELLDRLLDQQNTDGSFGGIAATGVALGALLSVLEQIDSLPGAARRNGSGGSGGSGGRGVLLIDPDLESRLRRGVDEALHFLASAHEEALHAEDGAPALLGDAIDTAVLLWQLAGNRFAGDRLRLDRLHDAAQAHGLSHNPVTSGILAPVALRLAALESPLSPSRAA